MSGCLQRVRLVLTETGRGFERQLVDPEKTEHATVANQPSHPKGLVPGFVEDGRRFIESVGIIGQIAGDATALSSMSAAELPGMADAALLDLKLLTFVCLFRVRPGCRMPRPPHFRPRIVTTSCGNSNVTLNPTGRHCCRPDMRGV